MLFKKERFLSSFPSKEMAGDEIRPCHFFILSKLLSAEMQNHSFFYSAISFFPPL